MSSISSSSATRSGEAGYEMSPHMTICIGLTEVLAGSRTTESAAGVLGVSMRQVQRLLGRYRDGSGGALIYKSRGQPASNRLGLGIQGVCACASPAELP